MADLNGLAKKKTKKASTTKKKGIVLEAPQEVQEKVNAWVENNRAMKDAKASMEQCEQTILDFAEPQWRGVCQKEGKVETSVKIGNIRVSWKGKSQFVTSSSLGDGERAKAVFGEDYEKYFKEIDGPLELTSEAANHPEISERLAEAVQSIQEDYPDVEILTRSTKVVPTEVLYNEWVTGNHEEIEQKFAAAGIKRTKPTFAQR